MSVDRTSADAETAEATQPGAATTSEPTTTEKDTDTEGQMMLPDSTAQHLARDRERDIRQHLSRRDMERQAKDSRQRK